MRKKIFCKALPLLMAAAMLTQTTEASAVVTNIYSYESADSSSVNTASSYTGMKKVNGKWIYVVNGEVATSYTGLVKYKTNWVYVVKGQLNTTYTGLVKYKTNWVYVNKGKLDATYTGLVKYKTNWVYVNKGKLDTSYTGMVKYKSKWVYVNKGKLDAKYTGLARNKYGWWHMTAGALDLTYTGMSKNQYGWWYVEDGALDLTYTGISVNRYGMWYMKNGKLDQTYTGEVKQNGKIYNVVNGKVVSQKVEEVKALDLTVWCPAEDQDSGWIQEMCEEFNALHPEWDITFKFETCSEGDAGNMVTQDPEAAGDVFFFTYDQIDDLLEANALTPITGSTLEYVKETNCENMVNTVTYDGKVYGIPFTANTWFMYYDKRIFTEEDVKSLDTMLTKGKVVFPLTNTWYFQSFYAAVGGVFCGPNGDDEAAGIVLGDKATAATKYIINFALRNENYVYDNTGGFYGIKDSNANAFFSGTWDYQSVVDALGEENVGICQPPTINVEGKDYRLKAFMGSKAIGVNSHTENKEVAMAFAQYLSSEEAQLAHYEARGVVPCNTKLLATDALKNDALVQAQANTAANASIIQPHNRTFNNNWWENARTFANMILDGVVSEETAADRTYEFEDAINGEY